MKQIEFDSVILFLIEQSIKWREKKYSKTLGAKQLS